MPAYIHEFHDVGLLRSDGTTKVGLMLARDPKTNQPIYRTVYDDYFVQRAYASALDYAATDPQQELRLIYSDWRRGFGQYIFDSGDQKRYYSSIGCDLRNKDMAVAGPVATAVALPVAHNPTIVNSDMELETGWNYGGAITRSNTQAHGGTYSLKIATNNNNLEASQDLTNFVPGAEYVFTCWFYATGATTHQTKIGINDGLTTTYCNVDSNTGSWIQLTVTKTISAAATRLRLLLYSATSGGDPEGDCYFDDAACTMSSIAASVGAVVTRAEFNDALYVASGKVLAKLNTSTGATFTTVAVMPATITDLEVFGNYLFIAQGTGASYYYMATTELLTLSTLTVKTFQFFCTVNSAAPTLWGNDGANTIRSTTNPLNGGTEWSAQTTVDASANAITDMIQKSGALYIMKEDVPYYLNGAGAVQSDLAPECKSLTASTSGKNVVEWLKKLYIPVGAQGLLETDGTTNTWRNPSGYSTNLGDFTGRVQALASDEEWLFAIVDNDAKVEVLAGREETVDGTTDWVWHPICEITLTGAETAWVSSVYQKRLWITSTSSSDSVYYIPLPTGYGNITADANRSFKTNSYFITPFYHGGFKGDTKRFIKVVATLGHAYDADIYWECWYKKLEDSGWTDAGDFIGTSTNRIATLYLPVDASSNKPKSTMMQFKLVAKTDDTQKTPVLLAFDVRAVLYPAVREIIECEVVAGDYISDKEGQLMDGVSATYIETVIDEARDSEEPFSFYDPWGNTHTVKMLPVSPYSFMTYDRKSENPEQHFILRLQKLTLS